MEAPKQISPDLTRGKAILIQHNVTRYRLHSSPDSPGSKEDYTKAAMSDAYINQQASSQAYKNYNDSFSRKAEKGLLFIGLPIAASIAAGALRPVEGAVQNGIVEKVKNTLKAGKWWAVAIGGLFAAFKAIDVIAKKIPEVREFSKEHPGTSMAGALAAMLGGTVLANPLVDAVSKQISKISLKGESLGSKVTGTANEFLNKLKGTGTERFLNNSIYQPVGEFLTNNPAGKFVRKYGAFLLLGGVLTKIMFNNAGIKKDKEKIKQELENERKESLQRIAANPFSGSRDQGVIRKREINRIIIIPAAAETAGKEGEN